jgi:hypothetical protein
MPLSDSVLEFVFSFLLEGEDADLRLVALPACRLLQVRRLRGFDHVNLRVCRMGLEWALRQKAFSESVCDYYRLELRRLRSASLQALEPSRLRIAPLRAEVVWNV